MGDCEVSKLLPVLWTEAWCRFILILIIFNFTFIIAPCLAGVLKDSKRFEVSVVLRAGQVCPPLKKTQSGEAGSQTKTRGNKQLFSLKGLHHTFHLISKLP